MATSQPTYYVGWGEARTPAFKTFKYDAPAYNHNQSQDQTDQIDP